ncbi:hypothetical protein GmHk_10G028128 [Glycine max]|nr:hypothetical protein GmHk_10G028128 [Glycine max]
MFVCIRCSLTIAAIEQPSSSQHSISKKRKTTASFQLRSSDTQFPDTTVSPEASVSSTGTVVSGDFCSDRSCCSSSHFKDLHSVPSDLQTKGFQTVEDSTNRYFKPFRFLSYLVFVRVLSHVRAHDQSSNETLPPKHCVYIHLFYFILFIYLLRFWLFSESVHSVIYLILAFILDRAAHHHSQMATQSNSPPPPPPSTGVTSHSSSPPLKRTRKASRLRLLATRPVGAERPLVHVDPVTGKADGPHSKKFRTYLGIVARDKVDVTYENWKHVPITQKDLIWEDIQAEFDIPEASDLRTKKKILQTVGERWRQFKSDLTSKWALAADKDSVDDTVCKMYGISKEKWTQFCQSRRDPSWENVRKKAQAVQKQNTAPHVMSRGGYEYLEKKLMDEKRKKKLEEATQSGSTDTVIDPPSPIKRHVKWKLARTKKTGDMTSEAAKEIADKIDALEEQASQGSFVTHGRHDILTAAIGRPEHPGRVRAVGAGITIKQYFGSASRTSSIAPEYLQQLTQQIKDQLEDSITEKVTRRLMLSLSQMQSQGLTLPPEPDVGPSAARVSTKESCVDPSGNDLDTGDSYKCGLYIEEYPSRLVALGRVYEGSTTIHNIPLLHDQVKVGVEEIRDVDAPIPVPTKEVKVVGQALNTFLAWPTHLVKRLSEQGAVRPAKPADRPDDEVDDPLYLMTLTIPQLFLKPLQVMWDATLFGLFNENFPLYIKHEDLSEIAHGGQCLSISVIQLWILMRAGNIDVYGFLEPQSIQRSGQSQFESENYIKNWMQNSKRDVYLGAYLNGAHWQMVVILPKENVVIWFCSLHNKPDNYLKGIINSALKGLDDTQQSKSKTPARWIVVKCNRQKGSTECGYYVMHWMSTIILGNFQNNWEMYFTDPRPLEPERLKALRNQWAKYYLKVKNET